MTNNITSKNICDASMKANVENLILISSIRLLGQQILWEQQRLSEIIFQAMEILKTIFSMVRFGNVLGHLVQ